MPVRIVKDNPNEEIVNDDFNFDNPNGNSDNDSNENFNNNSDTNNQQSGGGFDLGGIANMLFGGGGGSSHNGGNSIFASLASMAIGACVNYATNSFQNSRATSTQSMQGSSRSREDVEELYQSRMQGASLAVSLWAYAVGADRNFNDEERQAVERLLNDTIQQLFPSEVANQNEVRQELRQIFENPMDYNDVVEQASQNSSFAKQLYQQAALIVNSDGNNSSREKDFLNNLAADLGINI
jgi:uncharacterized membrane protein YebE (DUF533 family)